MKRKDENEVIFVEGTGHVYTKREQMLADIILNLVTKWNNIKENSYKNTIYFLILKKFNRFTIWKNR